MSHAILDGVLRSGAPVGVMIAEAFARTLSVERFEGYLGAWIALSIGFALWKWQERTELRAEGMTIQRGFRTVFIPWWSLGAIMEHHAGHRASLVAVAPIATIRLPAPNSTWGFRDPKFNEKRDVIHQWAAAYAGPHIWR